MKLGIFLIALGGYGAYGVWLLFPVLKILWEGGALPHTASTLLIFPLGVGALIWLGVKRIRRSKAR